MARLDNILPGGFDAQAVAPQENRSFGPLPAGVYLVEITNADVKDLKSGKGVGLNVEYTVIDGQYAKRKVWQNINIKHESSEAERIGQSQLSALCRAVGIPHLTDSDQLFQKMLRIGVKVRKQEGYDPSNDVTGYEPSGSAPAPTPAAAPARAAAPSTPPWQRKAA
jgi:hypothetical protein